MAAGETTNLAWAVRQDLEGAMDDLVRVYQDRLFGYALRLIGDRFDAQEIAQDALVKAYQCLAFEYDERQCLELLVTPWLFRITRNLALNRLRSRRRFPAALEDLSPESDDPVAGVATDPGTRLEILEDRVALEKALFSLCDEERELVALRFVEDMTYSEITSVTGIGEASARGKVFRALRRLRVILSEE